VFKRFILDTVFCGPRGILNKKINPFPGEAAIECRSNFENLWYVY